MKILSYNIDKKAVIRLSSNFATSAMAFSLILGSFSCKKFIEIPPPTSQLVTASVFGNNASASSAVTDIYTQMFNNAESPTVAIQNGELADELKTASTNGANFQYYINDLNNSQPSYGQWVDSYSYIYQANAIISGLQKYQRTSPAVKQQLLGEAYFIRAFWHFYLSNAYGAIPVALTTDYTVTSHLSRTPRIQVLQQVITDLQTAKGLLSNNYVDASDTATTIDRVRPTKAVATALLARAYLYLGDYSSTNNSTYYTKADSAATAVISNQEYSLCTNLSGANSVFLANSSEAIWQLYTPTPASTDTQDGYYFILTAAPSSGYFQGNTVSPQLINAFEIGDQRQANWIGSITINGTTYYFPYKYKATTYDGAEYTMVLRLAEQYLIRSEAEAELGQTASAINDLNIIRNRAGLGNYAGATDKSSLLTAILHERQVELFTEWGHRWFDLNRALQNNPSGVNVNTVMSVVTPQKSGTWSSDGHQKLYPVPLSEIQLDPNLTQNPGY